MCTFAPLSVGDVCKKSRYSFLIRWIKCTMYVSTPMLINHFNILKWCIFRLLVMQPKLYHMFGRSFRQASEASQNWTYVYMSFCTLTLVFLHLLGDPCPHMLLNRIFGLSIFTRIIYCLPLEIRLCLKYLLFWAPMEFIFYSY